MLVDVPPALIAVEPALVHFTPGLAHGTEFMTGCSERAAWEHAAVVENRSRFAALALLFGWIHGGDLQFIYENSPPHLVHSVDHGHFFPGGPDWTVDSLSGAPPAAPNGEVMAAAGLGAGDLDRRLFAEITESEIAAAIAAVPDSWALAPEERVALGDYLGLRRELICTA
jgi:hypothetical protein